MASFGQRLRRLRRDRGLTQRDLAQRLDVDRRTIQRYELGQIFPVPEILAALVLALALRFEDLFTLAPPMPREPSRRGAIAADDIEAEA
ncbi:MAG TPA: helix-turn-helix transcriptional regulator [Thermoanaerobaculia bacterium]|nr:helix-turn-helix transcriptional regulator [Thermoanaerobaculia bacterium]